MKVYHGSYLPFYITDKKLKVNGIIIQIWLTATFVFSCFVAIKLAVCIETACSFKVKC